MQNTNNLNKDVNFENTTFVIGYGESELDYLQLKKYRRHKK